LGIEFELRSPVGLIAGSPVLRHPMLAALPGTAVDSTSQRSRDPSAKAADRLSPRRASVDFRCVEVIRSARTVRSSPDASFPATVLRTRVSTVLSRPSPVEWRLLAHGNVARCLV